MGNLLTKRIFLAVNLPAEIKNNLGELQSDLKNSFPDESGEYVAKWVIPENLHITMLFVGEISQEKIEKVTRITQECVLGWKKFEVKIDQICYGPAKLIPPRFIWARVVKNMDLECLSKMLSQKINEQGILHQVDNRGFSPHITLARIKEWVWKKIEPEERPNIETEMDLSFQVQSIDLMESVLKRSGSEYKLLQEFKMLSTVDRLS
ncbi:MAG: RNA 2',3'-cyclic phosphodiesterase [Candidatus Gribaldobacteria bacterium]|nr:RNA 2',3'-cyclic phosphodiesterase [Candidatus Gribaldobacteria bacterium]